MNTVQYPEDPILGNLDVEEPETWSETVEKKTLKKMNPKDIKRQDTIWGRFSLKLLEYGLAYSLQAFYSCLLTNCSNMFANSLQCHTGYDFVSAMPNVVDFLQQCVM